MQRPTWLDSAEYPFAPHVFQHPAGAMHYIDEGQGEPILFLHGTPSWSFEWRKLVAALSAHYRCIAPDLLGFGLSEKPVNFAYTPATHAETIAALVRHLNLENISFVLHDFGGPIGFSVMADSPALVKRAAIMNTWVWGVDDPIWPASAKRAARALSGRFGKFLYLRMNFSAKTILKMAWKNRRTYSTRIHKHYTAPFATPAERAGTFAFAKSLLDASPWFAAQWAKRGALAHVPMALIWGMSDPAVSSAHLARWVEAFPQATAHELPGIGHWLAEEAPSETLAILEKFFAPAPADSNAAHQPV